MPISRSQIPKQLTGGKKKKLKRQAAIAINMKKRGKKPKGKNKTAYELARERKINARLSKDDLIRSANALKGVEISKGVTTGVLKSLNNKLTGSIPFIGSKKKK